jgi:hypothetical protein
MENYRNLTLTLVVHRLILQHELTESGRKISLAIYDGMVMITLLACTETIPSGVSYANTYPWLSDFVMLVSFHESLTLLPNLEMKECRT